MKLKALMFVILTNLWLVAAAYAENLSAKNQQDFTQFSGPYLGLIPPEFGAEVFLPNLVSTNLEERCVTFIDSGRVMLFTTDDGGTLYTWLNGERWMPVQPVPFNYRDDMLDYTAGPDGRSLVFMTSRPFDEDDKTDTHHLWTVQWTGNEWGEPTPLPAPRKIPGLGSGYPTLASDGKLYFFASRRPTEFLKDSTGKPLPTGRDVYWANAAVLEQFRPGPD